jgi:hypothetical protein
VLADVDASAPSDNASVAIAAKMDACRDMNPPPLFTISVPASPIRGQTGRIQIRWQLVANATIRAQNCARRGKIVERAWRKRDETWTDSRGRHHDAAKARCFEKKSDFAAEP